MSQTEMKIDTADVPKAVKPITPATVVGFLVGLENAINSLLHSRSTVWIGLLFVISAGFAREYDGESLLHEPWHLLIPWGASLVSSLVLFSLLAATCRLGRSFTGSFWTGYRHFLGLYWMTAPLAWLYAIPIERVFSPARAVQFNLILLAIVSLWRVLLMTRVVSVVFKCHIVNALVLVMLFADAVALSIIYLTPTPIFSMMGGIRLTESEQVIQSAHFMVGCGGLLTL